MRQIIEFCQRRENIRRTLINLRIIYLLIYRKKKKFNENGDKIIKTKVQTVKSTKLSERKFPETKKMICKFYLDNRCTFENCRFSHDLKLLPCKYYHVLGHCNHGDDCRYNTPLHRFSHDLIGMEEYSKFIKDNEDYINEISMKHSLKSPLAEQYAAELKRRNETSYQEMLKDSMLPDTFSPNLPDIAETTSLPSNLQITDTKLTTQKLPSESNNIPQYKSFTPTVLCQFKTHEEIKEFKPKPPETKPVVKASSYYSNGLSVFSAPPSLDTPIKDKAEKKSIDQKHEIKQLSLGSKLKFSGIIKNKKEIHKK